MCWLCSLSQHLAQLVAPSEEPRIIGERVSTDGGPVYAETNLAQFPVEPWSTATAFLFIFVALYFLRLVRREPGRYRFIAASMPVMLLGGIGSVLYHATRLNPVFMWLDALPLVILIVAVTLFLWRIAWRHWRWMYLLVPLALLGSGMLLRQLDVSINARITLHYAVFSIFVLLPVVIVLVRTGGRDLFWAGLALTSVTLGLWLRLYDRAEPPLFPMGTHWLMHVFGALAAFALCMYVYRLCRHYSLARPGELEPLLPLPADPQLQESPCSDVRV